MIKDDSAHPGLVKLHHLLQEVGHLLDVRDAAHVLLLHFWREIRPAQAITPGRLGPFNAKRSAFTELRRIPALCFIIGVRVRH